MRRYLAVVVVVCSVVLMGCGGGNTQAAVPTTESTTTTAAINYGKQYLDLVAPSNAQLDVISGLKNQADFPPAFEKLGVLTRDFANALLRAQWPENAKPAIQDLAESLIEEANVYSSVRSLSIATFNSQSREIGSKTNAKASVVRALLGLDPPPDDSSSTSTTVAA